MKFLLLRAFLAVTMLAPLVAPAELVLYKGTRRDTYTGEGHGLVVNSRIILMVDHDTAQAARVSYTKINGVKRYEASHWTNTHFVQIIGSRSSYTAIARSSTQCEIDSGSTGEGIYCKGVNVPLTLNTNSIVAFPRILSDHGNGLFYSDTSGQPILDEGSFQLVFDRAGTLASNQAGESLESALDRVTAHIKSLGYIP